LIVLKSRTKCTGENLEDVGRGEVGRKEDSLDVRVRARVTYEREKDYSIREVYQTKWAEVKKERA